MHAKCLIEMIDLIDCVSALRHLDVNLAIERFIVLYTTQTQFEGETFYKNDSIEILLIISIIWMSRGCEWHARTHDSYVFLHRIGHSFIRICIL